MKLCRARHMSEQDVVKALGGFALCDTTRVLQFMKDELGMLLPKADDDQTALPYPRYLSDLVTCSPEELISTVRFPQPSGQLLNAAAVQHDNTLHIAVAPPGQYGPHLIPNSQQLPSIATFQDPTPPPPVPGPSQDQPPTVHTALMPTRQLPSSEPVLSSDEDSRSSGDELESDDDSGGDDGSDGGDGNGGSDGGSDIGGNEGSAGEPEAGDTSEEDSQPDTSEEEGNDEDEPDLDTLRKKCRTGYAGRSTVGITRRKREKLGLNKSFPRDDKVLQDFTRSLRVQGAKERAVKNTVSILQHVISNHSIRI